MQYATYDNTIKKLAQHHITVKDIAQIAFDNEQRMIVQYQNQFGR